MVEFIFKTQFAVGKFHLKINGVEQTICHTLGFSEQTQMKLFEDTRCILLAHGLVRDVEKEWKAVCPYL